MGTSYIEWIRDLVGQRKIFLPFASVIVRDASNRFLLQKRTDFNVWGLPGGILELDEDIEACARRELIEETGLEVGNLRVVGIYTDPRYDVTYPNGDQVQMFTVCFEGLVSGGIMQADGYESSEQAFYALDQINALVIPLWYRDMILDAQRTVLPSFKPPYALNDTSDQIASVRPFIGKAVYSGVGATAIIVRDDDCILMLQHKHEMAWRPPAGFSDLGENVAQTAVREVWEETKLEISPERIIAIHSTPRLNVTYVNGDQTRNVGVVFRAKLLGGNPEIDESEIADLAWMTPENALANFDSNRRWFFKTVLAHLDEGYFVC